MKNGIRKLVISTLFLLSICGINTQAASLDKPQCKVPKSVISTPEEISSGTHTYSQQNAFLPSLTEGNHELWIERVNLPEYAKVFHELLEEGSDNDGKNDFLISVEDSPLVEKIRIEEIATDGMSQMVDAYGVKITEICGQGTDYDSAVDALNLDFDEKYYNLRTAQVAFDMDHSEVFWLACTTYFAVPEFDYSEGRNAETGAYTYTISGDLYFILKSPEHDIRYKTYRSEEAILADIARLDAKVEEIIAEANTTDDYELVKYFNYWLTMNNEHNCETIDDAKYGIATWYLPELFECTSALFPAYGDYAPECEGYARALAVLCKKSGIPCVLVTGNAKTDTHPDGIETVWNKVQIDGKWYGVDVAANDPVDTENKGNPVSGKEAEEYLMVGTDTLVIRDHYAVWMGFATHHVVENRIDRNGLCFTNDPVMERDNYKCTIKSLVLAKMEAGTNIVLSAQITRTSDAYGDASYVWYRVDEYGNEQQIPGVNTRTYTFSNHFNGGTYTFRVKVTLNNCIKSADYSFYIKGFSDVPKTAYYYNAVLWALDNKITAGVTANRFEPNMQCTRAQVITFLWRFYGCPKSELADNMEMKFADVEEGSYYYNAVLWALEKKIALGYTEKQYAPHKVITRAELAAYLWRAAGRPEVDTENADLTEEGTAGMGFTDVWESDWYHDAVYWAVENNITKGYTAEIFAPNATATRAEIVTFLYRAESVLLPEEVE